MAAGITRIGQILMVISILMATGTHWAALQVVAWGGMLVQYSQDGGVIQGVGKTFDGQHPCALCRDIEKGRQSEKSHPIQSIAIKLTLFCVLGLAFVPRRPKFWSLKFSDLWSEMRFIEPLLEPPRMLLS